MTATDLARRTGGAEWRVGNCRALAMLLSLLALVLLGSCSADDSPTLTMEEAHQQFLGRVTAMLRNCAAEVDSAIRFIDHVDTTLIPGRNWPFPFPALAPQNQGGDSLTHWLASNSGDVGFSLMSTLQFTSRDSSGRHPPAPDRPIDQFGYSIRHGLSVRQGSDPSRIDQRAQFSITASYLRHDTIRVESSFYFGAESNDSSPFDQIDYELLLAGNYSNQRSDLIKSPIGQTAVMHASVTDLILLDVAGGQASTWECKGRLTPDWRAILETRSGDFTSTDTVSFDPQVAASTSSRY